MDVVSDILSKVRLSSAVYFISDFPDPWGMDIPKGPFAQFHIVTRGRCVLKAEGKSIQLFAGDIVIFPFGSGHKISGKEKSKLFNGQDVVKSIIAGESLFKGDQLSTTLVCGHFEFDKNFDHPFIKELPSLIHITDMEKKEFSWLENITNLIIQESGKGQPGSNIIVNRLGEVLFVHSLRAYIEKSRSKKGFIAAIQDERISGALKMIHNSPEADWQLDSLAKVAGMSRTSFTNRFKALTGDTPYNYLTHWRLLQARELLTQTKLSVGEIADKVGYQSEAAFNRVFKKRTKQTPLKYRQHIQVNQSII